LQKNAALPAAHDCLTATIILTPSKIVKRYTVVFSPVCLTCLFTCGILCAFSLTSLAQEYFMPKSRTEQMVDRLRDLQAGTPDVEASAVVSVDGLIMASSLPAGVEEDRVSAMSAAMLSLGERIASELGRGTLDQVYIHGDEGYVILMAVGQDAVLTVLAREQAKLGLIMLDMRRAASDLERLI
jgi:predicted regulator of Ras-like GTPase activity (Roadblock/LC7/MglB family)